MKTAFVYYSFEGSCRDLSRHLAGTVGGDAVELMPVEDTMPRGRIMKYLVGGKNSILKKAVSVHPLTIDPGAYDVIFVGGPVWFCGMTPVMRGFLANYKWQGAKVAVFSMYRGSAGRVTTAMANMVIAGGGDVLGQEKFIDLRWRDYDKTKKLADAWVLAMINKVGMQA